MRLLAFDHFFGQDLDAIRSRLEPPDTLAVLPYRRLHRLASRYFPSAAFVALDSAYAAEMTRYWTNYQPVAARFADWVAAAYRPHVFIAPNDNFFYLRPVIEQLRALGVPTVVVQKETTIAPLTMDTDSEVIRRAVPFMGEVMTVCSERHREFAIRSGADPDRVIVTGQPRFDVYGPWEQSPPSSPPTLLYFSYDDLAYLPPDAGTTGVGTWRPLRNETEAVLRELAEQGQWRIVAKIHPQQQARDDQLGPRVHRADREADTRQLILRADAVVGFQTTALFEAAFAGKPLVYAAWGPVFEKVQPLLIPFVEHPELATHATGPEHLASLLRRPPADLPRPTAAGVALAEEHLGPVDGHATERVMRILRDAVPSDGMLTVPHPPVQRIAGGLFREVAQLVARGGEAALRSVGRPELAEGARHHAAYWRQEAAEARLITRHRLSGRR